MSTTETFDDFYVAYFDKSGKIIFPSDPKEVDMVNKLLKKASKSSLIFIEEKKLYYKVRIKRKLLNGERIQVVEISNVTEFFKEISNASVDEITKLNNRKYASNMFMQYLELAYQRGDNFSLILVDLDNFKEMNDTYGHINGDIVLSEVSRILYCATRQESYRERDIVARIGGDEFLMVMKNAPSNICEDRAERIRKKVEEHKITLFSELDEIKKIALGTLSMGLYHVSNGELLDFYNTGNSTEEIAKIIMDRCDSALYDSKNSGKNRITVFSDAKILKLSD